MKDYQPWSEDWRKELTFVPWLSIRREAIEDLPVLPMYPIFVAGLEQRLEGEELWQAISGAILYLLGHEPDNPMVDIYVDWLNRYNSNLAMQMMVEGTIAASHYDLPAAIWMLQAALLMNPELIEANYNLGLAFSQLGDGLQKKNSLEQASSSYQQAYQYLKNAITLDTKLSMAYYTLGIACRRLGRQEEGKYYLEKAIILDLAKNEEELKSCKV